MCTTFHDDVAISANPAAGDGLVLLRIEGMHCHRCEQAIAKSLGGLRGVREVEVDFASGQASVLHDRDAVSTRDLTAAVAGAGYKVTGFTHGATAATE